MCSKMIEKLNTRYHQHCCEELDIYQNNHQTLIKEEMKRKIMLHENTTKMKGNTQKSSRLLYMLRNVIMLLSIRVLKSFHMF